MKTAHHHPTHLDTLQNRFGLRVAARLSAGAETLPHDINERLRAAREQALTRRKLTPTGAPQRTTSAELPSLADEGLGFWGRLVSYSLALMLVAGLVAISLTQEDERMAEMADLDAALLTDELPPEAYADPGFLQYLKSGARAPGSISR